jgi:hypothetical protein
MMPYQSETSWVSLDAKDVSRFLSRARKSFATLVRYGFDIDSLRRVLLITAEYSALLILEHARLGPRIALIQRRRALNPAAKSFVDRRLAEYSVKNIKAGRELPTHLRRFRRKLERVLSDCDSLMSRLECLTLSSPLNHLKAFHYIQLWIHNSIASIDALLANRADNPIRQEQWIILTVINSVVWSICRTPCWKEILELVNAWTNDVSPALTHFITPDSLRMMFERYRDSSDDRRKQWEEANLAFSRLGESKREDVDTDR